MAIDREQIEEVLAKVLVPGVNRSLLQLNLLRDVRIDGDTVDINLADAAISPRMQDRIMDEVESSIQKLAGVGEVSVDFEESKPKDINRIEKVMAVMSGKGGVGKSLVTGLVALAMSRQGKSVGILDADVTGPSIPRMFGIKGRPEGSESGILPLSSRTGIEIMSMNLLLAQEDDAIIWRAPLMTTSITQFWEEVLWGKLDCLLIDMPPGTADIPLTVIKSIPLSGVIIVFTPQELAGMVVRKAIRMLEQMAVPVIGVVENMSYLVVSETGQRIEVFGPSQAIQMSRLTGAPILGRIPLDPELARLCDAGDIESYDSEVMRAFQETVTRVVEALK